MSAPPARGRRAGQQRGGDRLGAEQALNGREVLLCERLRRGQQRRLAAVLDGAQHRVQRDDRLAAADLAHQQPLHRVRAREILIDRVDRAPLVSGQPERQAVLEPARAERRLIGKHARAALRCAGGASAQEHQLRQQQLVEGQPAPSRLEVLLGAREVHRGERARAVRQALACARRGGQRLGDVGERAPRLAHEREDLRGADAVAGGIVRDRIPLLLSGGRLRRGVARERVM